MHLPITLRENLSVAGREAGTTFFMTLLAVFGVVLSRYSGQADIVVGTPIANRSSFELESLIGFFVNTLALPLHIGSEVTFVDLLEQVREMALGAYQHQDVPFEKLVEELEPERDLSRSPLFQAMLILQNVAGEERLALPGLEVRQLEPGDEVAKVDLTLTAREEPGGIGILFSYCRDLFDAATIQRMALHFENLLVGMVATPHQQVLKLPMLSVGEQQQVRVEWQHGDRLIRLLDAAGQEVPIGVWGQVLVGDELASSGNRARYLVDGRLEVSGKWQPAAFGRRTRRSQIPRITNPSAGPRNPVERKVAGIWREILGRSDFGVHDNFFHLGGHSLLATRVVARLRQDLGVDLPLLAIFEATTVADLAEVLTMWEVPSGSDSTAVSNPILLQRGDEGTPLFLVHPAGGLVAPYVELVKRLDPGQRVYGFQARGLEEGETPAQSIEEAASDFVVLLRKRQPVGPYLLGGWSMGGVIAFEMARLLEMAGEAVAGVALIDAWLPEVLNLGMATEATIRRGFVQEMGLDLERVPRDGVSEDDFLAALRDVAGDALPEATEREAAGRLFGVYRANVKALAADIPQSSCAVGFGEDVMLYQATAASEERRRAQRRSWQRRTGGPLSVVAVTADHFSIVLLPQVALVAQYLANFLKEKLSRVRVCSSDPVLETTP